MIMVDLAITSKNFRRVIVQKIKQCLFNCVIIGLILSQFNLPFGQGMPVISAQSETNSGQLTGSDNPESSESSSDLPPEPPKDFEPPVTSSSDSTSNLPEESSTDETSSSESSVESGESSSDDSQSSDSSQSSSQTETRDTTADETPIKNILPGSLMIKPMNMLEPVNVPTTVRRIVNYYGNITRKFVRTMVPYGQLLVFPYEGEIVSTFNLALVGYFENLLVTITN